MAQNGDSSPPWLDQQLRHAAVVLGLANQLHVAANGQAVAAAERENNVGDDLRQVAGRA